MASLPREPHASLKHITEGLEVSVSGQRYSHQMIHGAGGGHGVVAVPGELGGLVQGNRTVGVGLGQQQKQDYLLLARARLEQVVTRVLPGLPRTVHA